ncbi:MAG: protein of unknown function SprT, partial [Marmoricola sp.]|nr:protein of unknown function SprT [Marmoricola sp.]
DSTVDATPSAHAVVRGVHDRIDLLGGDVAQYDGDLWHRSFLPAVQRIGQLSRAFDVGGTCFTSGVDLNEALVLARSLVAEHGLVGWRVAYGRAKQSAGTTRFEQKSIVLSRPLTELHPVEEVRDTILHEIAHALVGPGHGHGPVWQTTARRIGSDGQRCVSRTAPRVEGAWVGTCARGHVVQRHRRPERVMSCRSCGPGFDIGNVFDWTHRGRRVPMHPNYIAELEAVAAGTHVVRFSVGCDVRVTAPGDFIGRVGTVVKRGRTSYHVRLPEGTLRVIFAGVESVR